MLVKNRLLLKLPKFTGLLRRSRNPLRFALPFKPRLLNISLAIAGDIVGCETLLFGSYTFNATALTPCRLQPWPEGDTATSGTGLLESLAQAQKRAADLLALRGGQASARVLGLIRLLADRSGQVILPTRQDIADITDLRFETISRIISNLQREHLLSPLRIAGIHATRSYRLAPGAFA